MKMGFFRVPLYFLCIIALNQALYATSGAKWMASSYEDLRNAAEANDSYAQGFLALVHAHGDKGKDITAEVALPFARRSALAGHWLGYFAEGFLARMRGGEGNAQEVRELYLKAFRDPDGRMIKAAASGDPVAAYALAEIFTSDEIRPDLVPDLDLAARHYSVSAAGGYGPAKVQFSLLKTHAIGDTGITKDLGGGIALLEETVRTHLPSAHFYLGRAYFKGIGVQPDKEMALVHFQAAADRGHAVSQLTVADFYAHGLVGQPKIDLALRYARLAIGQRETEALAKIAEYESLLAGKAVPAGLRPNVPSPLDPSSGAEVPLPPPPSFPPSPPAPSPDPPPPFSATRLTPDLPSPYEGAPIVNPPPAPRPTLPEPPPLPVPSAPGSTEETRELAKKHYFGRGSVPDYGKSLSLFTQSANAGDAEAARYLGIMYLRGKGVPKDNAKALEWSTLASDRGDALAGKNVQMLKSLLRK